MLINKRKNPLVTHLIVGAKEELTKAFKVQKFTDEIASRLKEELSHIVKECFRNEVEKKLDNSTRESIIRSALYTVINKV